MFDFAITLLRERVFKRLRKKIRYIFVSYDRARFRNYLSRDAVKDKGKKNTLLHTRVLLSLLLYFILSQ